MDQESGFIYEEILAEATTEVFDGFFLNEVVSNLKEECIEQIDNVLLHDLMIEDDIEVKSKLTKEQTGNGLEKEEYRFTLQYIKVTNVRL